MASCISSGTAEALWLRHEDGPGEKTVEAGMMGGGLRPLGIRDLSSRRLGRRARNGGWKSRTGPNSCGGGTGAGPQYLMTIETVF